MAIQVIQNKGYGGSAQAIADILRMAGQGVKLQQTRKATDNILNALASGDQNALDNAVREAVNYQADYGEGFGGLLRKLVATQAPEIDPGMAGLQRALPVAQMQQRKQATETSQAIKKQELEQKSKTSTRDLSNIAKNLSEAIIIAEYSSDKSPESAERIQKIKDAQLAVSEILTQSFTGDTPGKQAVGTTARKKSKSRQELLDQYRELGGGSTAEGRRFADENLR